VLRKQRRYTEAFRAEAVQLALASGQSIRQTALELGVSNQTLGAWIREGQVADAPRKGRSRPRSGPSSSSCAAG
jgi:transposase-like protein